MAKKSKRAMIRPMIDAQAMRSQLARYTARLDDGANSAEEEALAEAQDIAFSAMDEPDRAKRAALARKAIEISPRCADAHSILANDAATPADAVVSFEKAVEAGAAALGPDVFANDAGMFWGLLETRPYMRALHGLARAFLDMGAVDDAISRMREMLRLNPNDNQGARYELLNALIESGADADARALLKRYRDDPSAAFAWPRVLLAFRADGPRGKTPAALAKAMESNPHVVAYLTGVKKLPAAPPDTIGLGDDDEAAAYVHDGARAWSTTPGALDWLRDIARQVQPRTRPGPAVDGDKVDRAVLALLFLGLHDDVRSWKTFDWSALSRLHASGLIENPVGNAKSVVFTSKGLRAAEAAFRGLLSKSE